MADRSGKLGPLDSLVLTALLPLWLACLALSVLHVVFHPAGTVAFGAAAEAPGAPPRVNVLRAPDTALRVGDELLSVGGRDLRGAGYVRVHALANAARVSDPAARLEVVRDGVRLSLALPTTAGYAWSWWAGLSFSTMFGLSGLLLLLRARSWHLTRRYFVCSVLWSTLIATEFINAGGTWTYLAYSIRFGLWPAAAALLVWSALEWTPSALPIRPWQKALPWGIATIGLGMGANLLSPRRFVSHDFLQAALVTATGVATIFGILRCYRRADTRERRQLRWILYGFGLSIAVQILSVLFYLATGVWGTGVGALLANAIILSAVAIPLGFSISIIGYQYLDVDRLISATSATALAGAVLAAGAFALVPPVARASGSTLGLAPSGVQLVLSIALATLLVPTYQWLHPRIERRLFPEHEAIGAGFARLLDDLSSCRDATGLARTAGEGIDALVRPESIVTYAREGEAFTPIFARGRAFPPAFDASSALVASLRSRTGPLAAERFVRQAAHPLSSFDRAALDTLEVAVISPTHRRGELIAFQCLGPKRSGDVYTSTDLALLSAASSKIADLIERLDDAATLFEAREMQAALRRYVPGAVARELGGGDNLASGEREVTVLFVDIRGYTALAERLDAQEVFSTLNRHTEEVSAIVGDHGGAVVEFHGDGLMAVFGAPRAIGEKESRAVLAAREVIARLSRELTVGIGIATGVAYVGDIQAVDRRIWSVVGCTTNLAARLQALTRDLHASIAIDPVTRERAGAACVAFRLHEGQHIRGRTEPIDLWALPLDA